MWILDGRDDIDLTGWLRDDAGSREVMPGAREATDELCSEQLPCDQTVTSRTLTMYRFDEQEQAVAAARQRTGDAYLSGWIVIRFEPGALSAEQRRDAALCTNVGVTADGVEC